MFELPPPLLSRIKCIPISYRTAFMKQTPQVGQLMSGKEHLEEVVGLPVAIDVLTEISG